MSEIELERKKKELLSQIDLFYSIIDKCDKECQTDEDFSNICASTCKIVFPYYLY